MSIKNVNVKDYHEYLGGNETVYRCIRSKLPGVINRALPEFEGRDIDVYNLAGRGHSHTVGNKEKLIIFVEATSESNSRTYETIPNITINGKEYPEFTRTLKSDRRYEEIIDDNDYIIAGWSEEFNQVNIYFDLFKNDTDNAYEVLSYILEHVNNHFYNLKVDSYWNKTSNKDALKEIISNKANEFINEEKNKLEREIKNHEETIRDYHEAIIKNSNNLTTKMANLSAIKNMPYDTANKIINDFDLIVKNELIEDIYIDRDIIEVLTKHLDIHAQNGSVYKGAKYRIRVPLDTSYIRFFSDEGKGGFWTRTDPHPHVNGDNGAPCFGNLSSTIAELSSQYEIYALILLCLDFLQSVNEHDAAGEYIRNYELLSGDGVCLDDEDTYNCDCCGEYEESSNRAYRYYDERNNSLEDEVYVCDDCLKEHYIWNDDADEYVGEVYNEIEYAICANCGNRVDEDTMHAVHFTYNIINSELSDEVLVCEGCEEDFPYEEEAGVNVKAIIEEE